MSDKQSTGLASARCFDDLLKAKLDGEEVPAAMLRLFRREEDLIRSAMAAPAAIADCGVIAGMFRGADYQVAWDAIWRASAVHGGTGPVDPQSVLAEMRRANEARFAFPYGDKWIGQVCSQAPLSVVYALEVLAPEITAKHELAIWEHRFKQLSEKIVDAKRVTDVYQEWVTEAVRISSLANDGGRLGQSLSDVYESVSGHTEIIRTKITPFDRVTGGGPMTKDMVVVGAGTNVGKSYFAQRWCRNQVLSKRPVLYISAEDQLILMLCRTVADYSNPKLDPVSVRSRVLENASMKAGTNRTYTGAAPAAAFSEAEQKMRIEQHELFYSYYCPKWPVSKICAIIRRHAHIAGIKSVVLDYLQAVSPDEPMKDKTREVSSNVSILKRCCEENNVVLVLLSQLSRESYKNGEEPTLNDYKWAGDIENEAQVAALMWRGDDGAIRGKIPKTKWTKSGNNKYIIDVDSITGCFGDWKDDFSTPEPDQGGSKGMYKKGQRSGSRGAS